MRIRHVHQGCIAVIGDIEIKQAVPVDICDRDGHAATRLVHPGHLAKRLAETSASVPKQERPGMDRVDDQVEIPIAVQVSKRSSR